MKPERAYLVIDDDPVAVFLEEKKLKQFDPAARISIAPNGHEALNLLRKDNLPDYILLDLKMPVMDGWQFIDGLLESFSRLPDIFIVTSSISGHDKERAGSLPCIKGFISKPLTLEQLGRFISPR